MLRILQSGIQPLGQFDGLDSQVTATKGGEVVTLTAVTPYQYGGTDVNAADVNDGYAGTTTKVRPAVTTTLGTAAGGPYWLCDDGTTGYGTLFGSVIGAQAGTTTSGTNLGPHTATGSGKLTCWTQPGLYGVTVDAAETTAATGLVPTNSTLTVGAALYATPAGLLTPNSATGTANAGAIMGRFVEFATDGSLVTTPVTLVAGFQSPSSDVSSLQNRRFTMAIFYWLGK